MDTGTTMPAPNGWPSARLEMFSDGVFAIAITLLVLDLHVPDRSADTSLFTALMHEWPHYLAFLVGFFTILVCWINHHHMFTLIHRCDSGLILVNGFKLLVVSITPFATALLSKNVGTSWAGSAVSVYAFNFALMGVAMTGVWFYAKARSFIHAPADVMKATSRLYVLPSVLATAIWLLSFVSTTACLVLTSVMFCIFILPERSARMLMGRKW